MQKEEDKKPITIYPTPDLLKWLEEEAVKDRRSRTGQIEYFLEEARRIREHNRKAMQHQEG